MIRRYCDICDTEIPDGEIDNAAIVEYEAVHAPRSIRLEVRISRAINGVANSGHVCADCLKHAIWDGQMHRAVHV